MSRGMHAHTTYTAREREGDSNGVYFSLASKAIRKGEKRIYTA